MLGRIGSGTFSEVFTVSLRVSTQHRVYRGNTSGIESTRNIRTGWIQLGSVTGMRSNAVTSCMPMGG